MKYTKHKKIGIKNPPVPLLLLGGIVLGLTLIGTFDNYDTMSQHVAMAESEPENSIIPSWIKDTVRFWTEGRTTDNEFLSAVEYLANNGIIIIPSDDTALDIDTLTIGFIPVEKADELTPKAESLERFLEDRLDGVDVKIRIPTNYETIIEGMRFGHIDAAFMDTGPAWITHKKTGAEAVLAEIVDGKRDYKATVWTKSENADNIQSINDVVGKRVAFTSITGSSGFIRPMGTLVTQGHITVEGNDIIALEKSLVDSFEAHTFAGGYKAALELVLNDNVDVAFGSDIAPQKYLSSEDQAKLHPVVTIGPVPSHVFMVREDMSESTRQALVDALIELNYEQNNHILTDLYGAEALLPTSTRMHIGDFGTFIDALVGIDQLILDKYNKNK